MTENPAIRKRQKPQTDWLLLATAGLLVIIGLIAIYDASVVSAFRDFGDRFYYVKNQLAWAALGFLVLGFFSFFNYHKILKFSTAIFVVGIILLVLVLIPGIGTQVLGAKRWISIASFTFQPSEFAKLATIFYAVTIMAKFEKYKIRLIDSALVYFLPILIVAALVIL